jgi:hypothetical protein
MGADTYLDLAPDIFWRTDNDCVLISTASGVLRLVNDFHDAWLELVDVSGKADLSSLRVQDISLKSQALLKNLVEEGLVKQVNSPPASWQKRFLGHLQSLPQL